MLVDSLLTILRIKGCYPIKMRLRGHVSNKKQFQKSKKTLEVGEWVSVQLEIKIYWETYFYTLFDYAVDF